MRILILIVVTLIISCQNFNNSKNTENNKNMISESEIYEIINFVLLEMKNNDSLENYQGKYVVDKIGKPSFFILRKDSKELLSKFFTDDDFNFIEEQLQERETFKLKQEMIVRKIIISKDTLNSLIDNNSPKRREEFLINYEKKFGYYYNEFSLPLFSRDKKTVLIEVNSFMGGGRLIILKKNKKWESKIISFWT